MDEQYWRGRWERGETGWHQTEVEPNLVAWATGLRATRVLVPLCGKSLDVAWLASQGHEVVGVELTETACRAFFAENKLSYVEERRDGIPVFRGERITILNTNVFNLTPALVGKLGAVYDRAALIALPPELRARYAPLLTKLIREGQPGPDFRMLEIVLERMQPDTVGPPFSVKESELEALYGASFDIRLLKREKADLGPDAPPTDECTYLLTLR